MEWDSTTHLLAAAVDHLAVANWMTATINSGEDADPLDYPEAVPRPAPASDPLPSGPVQNEQAPASALPTLQELHSFFS
ncbi:hypothetical protein ACFYN0_15705 [Streptomyces sp. NPDC006704]|uniref:hypothetical protein n=1 Tax=Streptomyces sp. NPDC006704 TaxID=3364760 RepID=UPI0036C2E434